MEGGVKKFLGEGLENEKGVNYSGQNILGELRSPGGVMTSEASQNAFGVIVLYLGLCKLIYVYNFHLLYVTYI